jgi:alpha-mannosidase
LPASASFLDVEPSNILLAVCKKAEDGDTLIVRGYESAGRPTRATLRMPQLGVTWRADFGAHEIKSWRVTFGAQPVVEEVDFLENSV